MVDKLEKILKQAKESIKILETLQKEALDRAKIYINLPAVNEAKKISNEKIVATLKKLGLATQSEVRELEKKVEDMASELRQQINKVKKNNNGK